MAELTFRSTRAGYGVARRRLQASPDELRARPCAAGDMVVARQVGGVLTVGRSTGGREMPETTETDQLRTLQDAS